MAFGKTIELFLTDGTTDSVITAELSNWSGKAIKIPRVEVSHYSRADLDCPGIYFLICNSSEYDSNSVYIGESESILMRLKQHLQNFNAEKETYYWQTAVVFTGRDLNKADVRYLEAQCVRLAAEAKRYEILTQNTFNSTTLKESQIATLDEFIENCTLLLNALGYPVLKPLASLPSPSTAESASQNEDKTTLYLRGNGYDAVGQQTSEGFVIQKSSQIRSHLVRSAAKNIKERREEAELKGDITDWTATRDLLFSSPSAAASFVLGNSTNGLTAWKDSNGRTLKDLETQRS